MFTLDSPVQPKYADPDFSAYGKWTTLRRDGVIVGTLWTDGDKGFGFFSAHTEPEIDKDIRFYVQTSANAGVSPVVAYGVALTVFPDQFGLTVEKSDGVMAKLFRCDCEVSVPDKVRR